MQGVALDLAPASLNSETDGSPGPAGLPKRDKLNLQGMLT